MIDLSSSLHSTDLARFPGLAKALCTTFTPSKAIPVPITRRSPRWPIATCAALFGVAALAGPGANRAHGQELMRDSLAGADVAEARRPSLEEQNYNLRVGPVRFLFSANAGVEYIDNINYSDRNRVDDVLLRAGFNVSALWNVTKLNTLALDLGFAYVRYAGHPDATNSNAVIAPGSQVSFDVFVADIFRLNFHDRFDLRQDPVDNPTLSNVTDFARFTNTLGVTAVADLNTIVLTLGYDHFNYLSLNSRFDYLDRSAEQVFGSAVYALAPRTFLGAEATFSYTDYDRNFQNDSTGGTVGGYFDITFNPYVRLIARAGYQYASFDSNGRFGDGSDLNAWYGNVTVQNRVNAYLIHSLSLGRENDLGLTSNYIKVSYARWNAAWNFLRNFSLGTDLFYEHDEESGGLIDETLNRYGGGFTLGYQFNFHLSAAFHYAYVQKDSDRNNRDYYQNRVGLDMNYRF